MDLGMQEIFLIAVVALLVYGGELPSVMRSLGRTVGAIKRSFQDGTRDMSEKLDIKLDTNADGTTMDDLPRLVRRAPAFPSDRVAPIDVATEDISDRAAHDAALPLFDHLEGRKAGDRVGEGPPPAAT